MMAQAREWRVVVGVSRRTIVHRACAPRPSTPLCPPRMRYELLNGMLEMLHAPKLRFGIRAEGRLACGAERKPERRGEVASRAVLRA